MNTVTHNANNEDNDKQDNKHSTTVYHDRVEKRGSQNTPKNNTVDVFEFEPNGFMSNGRW